MRRLLFTCLRVHQAFFQSYAVCGITAHGCQGSAKCPAHTQVPHTLAGTTWEAEEEGYVRHLLSICDRFAPGTTDLVRISLMREPSVRCEAASFKQAASSWSVHHSRLLASSNVSLLVRSFGAEACMFMHTIWAS